MLTNLIVLLVLLLLSAFFSGAEVAFLSLSDAKVDSMVSKKLPRSKLIKKLRSNPRRILVTILIGNNIVNIAASSFATVVATDLFDSAVVGIVTGVMTLLILIIGEILPKAYATAHPQKFAISVSLPLRIFQWISWPLVVAFEFLSNLMTGKHQELNVSEEELKAMAKLGAKQGSIQIEEGQMLEKILAFNDISAEDIMTPRVHVTFIQDDQPIYHAAEIIKENQYTRYPIYHDTPDNVTGFVHSRDVLLGLHTKKETTIKDVLLPIVTIPKQMRLDDIMREFQKRQTHIAVVVDEYGGTEGIVTFEDVIEELVGEISDEHDIDENLIQRIDKNTIHVAGDTLLRDVNDFLNCFIPGNELDTMAEIILDHLQKLPRKNDELKLGNTTCKILQMKKRRIELVEVKKED
ncbi:HlyC/CorC family transporter [Candidatus Nomurabacteria bacterium]|nr:HlyC/CorC family transporter [Candidatus Nomurabacteria bacterium]